MYINGVDYSMHAVHSEPENQDQGKKSTHQRDNMPFNNFGNNKNKHCDKNNTCKNLCDHFFTILIKFVYLDYVTLFSVKYK